MASGFVSTVVLVCAGCTVPSLAIQCKDDTCEYWAHASFRFAWRILVQVHPTVLDRSSLATVPIALLFPDMDTESIFYMSAAVVLIWMGLFGARRTLIVTSSLSMYILWSSFSVALIAELSLW